MKNEKIPHYGNSSKILLKIVEWSKPITHKWTTAHFPSLVQISQKKNCYKKSLKIPKEQSESVFRRRTDNTMAKRNNNVRVGRLTIPRRVTRVTRTGSELMCSGGVSSSCSTCGTHCVNLVTDPVISREWGKDRDKHMVNNSTWLSETQWPINM